MEKKMTLEQRITSLFPEGERFDVIGLELWGNRREGFDCNNTFYVARNIDKSEALEAARARWEAFKVNYHPKAKVSDIEADGWDGVGTSHLSVDCIPWLEIRAAK